MSNDNKSKLLQVMSDAINDLEQEYHDSSVVDRVALQPPLEDLLTKYAELRLELIQSAQTITQADIDTMQHIKAEIDAAAQKQQLLAAIAKTVGFIATKL